MSLETIEFSDFSGGINFLSELASSGFYVYDLGPGEMTFNSEEVEVYNKGKELRPRRGIKGFTTSVALPTMLSANDAITNVKTWHQPGLPDKLIVSNGNGLVARLDPNNGSPATWTSVIAAAATAEYEFIQAQDSTATEYVWMLNGISTPQKMAVLTPFTLSAWAGTPPNGKFHRVWKNRMIISGVAAQPQRIYYSDIANPESWPANNFIDIKSTDDESEAVIALEVIGENLLVFKEKSVWFIFDPVSFENRRLGDVGCLSRSATARSTGVGGGDSELVYWVAREGVFSTDGDTIREESKMISRIFMDSSLPQWGSFLNFYAQYTRLVMSSEGKLYLFNYNAWGSATTFSLFYMDTALTRSDGQHPWFRFADLGSGVVCMVDAYYRDHNAGVSPQNRLIGFLLDGPLGNQYAADIFKETQVQDNYTGVAVDVIGVVEFSEATLQGGVENKSRLRRLNFLGRAGFVAAHLLVDRVTNYTGPTLTIPTGGFVRCRPEMRGRRFQLRVTLTSPSNSVRGELHKIEMKIRGGVEH